MQCLVCTRDVGGFPMGDTGRLGVRLHGVCEREGGLLRHQAGLPGIQRGRRPAGGDDARDEFHGREPYKNAPELSAVGVRKR